ncbi:hypothetical protein ACMYYO_09800 [Dermacoccaceae bacterium W4C1]
MTSAVAPRSAGEAAPRSRVTGIDLARCLALLSMFVAHAAPDGGRLNPLLNLSAFLTTALFAATVAVGCQLGWESARAAGVSPARFIAGGLVRGLCLVVLGLISDEFGAYVIGILVHLGALTFLCSALVMLPRLAVAAVGLLAFLAGPWIRDQLRELLATSGIDPGGPAARALDVLGAGAYYRLPTLLAWACLAVLAFRWSRTASAGATAAVGGVGVVAGLALVAAQRLDVLSFRPHSGDLLEVVTNGGLAVGTMLVFLSLPPALNRWLQPLAWMGAMTLTLYVAHLATLALWSAGPGRGGDDSWVVLGLLVLGSLALAVGWRALQMSPPWRYGPLEGATGAVTRAARAAS